MNTKVQSSACSTLLHSSKASRLVRWKKTAAMQLMLGVILLLPWQSAVAALMAPDCYYAYNACIKAGNSSSSCHSDFVACVDRVHKYGIGFDGPLGKFGMYAVKAYTPGETLPIDAGRMDFATGAYLEGTGDVIDVTFVYVSTEELYNAPDMAAVDWTVIGPGIFNPATNVWEINWTVPGTPAPMGYEVAAIFNDPSESGGQVTGGLHATENPSGGRLAQATGATPPAPASLDALVSKLPAHSALGLEKSSYAYPVPATQDLTLRFQANADAVYEITLTDLMGREVMRLMAPTALPQGTFERRFDVSALPPGQYIYRVRSAHAAHAGRCVKQ
jgi:Secretion system C-terminal sorting domain